MAYYNKGVPEVRNSCPAPPYNSSLNPNFTTFANQPQFPLDTGSNAQQLQGQNNALSYFMGMNQRVLDVVNSPANIPYPTFRSQGERILYLQGQTAAAAKGMATQMVCSTIYDYINSPDNYSA